MQVSFCSSNSLLYDLQIKPSFNALSNTCRLLTQKSMFARIRTIEAIQNQATTTNFCLREIHFQHSSLAVAVLCAAGFLIQLNEVR